MDKEKIIEIARFRKIDELICKQCGTVNALESVSYEFNGPKVKALCPECGAYIRFMPTRKAWRIFKNKAVQLVEIEKIDNGYLDWYLRTVDKIPADLRNAIEQLIERRTTDPAQFHNPPADLDTKKIMDLKDRERFLTDAIVKLKNENRTRAAKIDPNADYLAVKNIQNILGAKALIINDYEKDLRRVLKTIAKIETE